MYKKYSIRKVFFFEENNNVGVPKMSLESAITDVRNEFEEILSYVCGAPNQQMHDIERGIFQRLLKIGLALLIIFIKRFSSREISKEHYDRVCSKRKYHSLKGKSYFSVFGKIEIYRPYYWKKGSGGVFPLDAELNLPDSGYSYLLQEWGTCLATEQPYAKAADFLKKFLGIPLWDSVLEEIVSSGSSNVKAFYSCLSAPANEVESELLVATVDCKGILMRKSELEKKTVSPLTKYRRMTKLGEKAKKPPENIEIRTELRDGKKKMACVTAVYEISRNIRTVETILAKHNQKEDQENIVQHRPRNKIVYGTLSGKQEAFDQLKTEISKRGCNAKRIALVDGEAKLTELLHTNLSEFEIIRDIVHVKEYLWDAAHVFYSEGDKEAQVWVSERFEKLLRGQVKNVIMELNTFCKKAIRSKTKKKALKRVITYLENGQEYMKYDRYLAEGYPIGSGVIEGTCKNLINDRCEHSGMHWSVKGANAMLSLRSIHINKLDEDYWRFNTEQERVRLYSKIIDVGQNQRLVA